MIFKKKNAPDNQVPSPKWDKAKLITPEQAMDPNLENGFYVYQDSSGMFGAIQPCISPTGGCRMLCFLSSDPQEILDWLSVPAPDLPASPPLPDPEPSSATSQKQTLPNKKGSNRTRNHQIAFRLSPAENRTLQKRLEKSGLSKQDFLLQAALDTPLSSVNQNLIDGIAQLYVQLDTNCDRLRQLLAQNQSYKESRPDEWAVLCNAIDQYEELKQMCIQFLEKPNGNH